MFNTPSRASTPRRSHAGGPRPSSVRSSRTGTPAGPSSFRPSGPSQPPLSPALSSASLSAAVKRRSLAHPPASQRGSVYGDGVASDAGDDFAELTAETIAPPAQQATTPGQILKRDDFSAVTVFSSLPREVLAALAASDPYIDAATGHLDVQTGHGILVNTQTCYVWSFGERSAGAFSTCYTFPVSKEISKSPIPAALPHTALVPRSSGREPGLLLASIQGEVQFWDSITASLTGQNRSQQLSIALGANENVVALERSDATTYVLATSQSRLFRISVVSSGGRLQAQIAPFVQSRGLFGRLFGGSAGAAASTSGLSFGAGAETIVAVVPCPAVSNQGSKDVFAVGQRTIQKWSLSHGGGERLLGEQDIARNIANVVMGSPDEVANLTESINLELVHAAPRADGSIHVLYSYLKSPNAPFSYGIAVVSLSSEQGSMMVIENDVLEFSSLRDPRPYSSPRLYAPNGGPAVFVAFPDALVLTLKGQDAVPRFEQSVVLKDGARNRFLGCGSEAADVEASDPALAAMSCLSAQSGALLVEFSIEATKAFCQRLSEPAHRQAALDERLKSQIEQAVFFDQAGANPLSFAVTASSRTSSQGDAELVVEQISQEIVSSTSRYLRPFVDLREHLADRLSRLVALIEVINENNLLQLVSYRTRSRLCADAELLAAASDLWRHHNHRMGQLQFIGSGQALSTPLADAIQDVMNGMGSSQGQDNIRLFFRSQLTGIAAVFANLSARLREAEGQDFNVRVDTVAEIGRVGLTALTAAIRYKESAARQYALEGRCSSEVWTSRTASLQLLESLFNATERLIHDRTRELGGRVDAQGAGESDAVLLEQNLQKELKTNLCELARCTLTVHEERLSYLTSQAASASLSDGGSAEHERAECETKYHEASPRLLQPLVAIGRADRAFALAERHGDFRTLTELCVDASTGNPDSQIQYYLRRYGPRFGFELFEYYVETEQVKKLLSLDSEWDALVDEFLKARNYSRIAWLHDLKLQQYSSASVTLLSEATVERADLQTKNVYLSLGKLSYLANLTETEIGTEKEQSQIERIDDQLDLISIHEKLRSEFRAAIAEAHGGLVDPDPSVQAEQVVGTLLTAHEAQGDAAYLEHYETLSEKLLSGRVMTSEDLIDLLTLKDISTAEDVQGFVLALQVCLRATDLQASRLQAMLGFIWRRALLADDWQAISQTSNASDEEMQGRLESSAFYQTLLAAYTGADGDNEKDALALRSFVLSFSRLATTPSQQVLQARLESTHASAGAADDGAGAAASSQAGSLWADVEAEVGRVRALLGLPDEDEDEGGDYNDNDDDDDDRAQDDLPATGQWIREAKRKALEASRGAAMEV